MLNSDTVNFDKLAVDITNATTNLHQAAQTALTSIEQKRQVQDLQDKSIAAKLHDAANAVITKLNSMYNFIHSKLDINHDNKVDDADVKIIEHQMAHAAATSTHVAATAFKIATEALKLAQKAGVDTSQLITATEAAAVVLNKINAEALKLSEQTTEQTSGNSKDLRWLSTRPQSQAAEPSSEEPVVILEQTATQESKAKIN